MTKMSEKVRIDSFLPQKGTKNTALDRHRQCYARTQSQ